MPARFAALLVATAAWLLLWGALAASGALARFDLRPPPMAAAFAAMLGSALALGFSPLGLALARALPLWVLVGFQGFRLPLELVMHEAARAGIMPEVMSYSGYNFDIASGATALAVAWALRRGAPQRIVLVWSVLGIVLLLAIITIAVLAMPMIQAFGPDNLNTWVAELPFVYLPAVMVVSAVVGHVVILRKLQL
jgi:hypothetical protein